MSLLKEVAVSPTIELLGRRLTNWKTIILKKFSHCWENSRPHKRLPNLGIWQRDQKSSGNLTLKVSRFDYRTSTGLGKQRLLEDTNKIMCTPGPRRKELWPHKWLTRLACVCLGVSGGGMGWQWPVAGSGTLTTTVLGGPACWRKSFFWRRSTLQPLPPPRFGLRPNYGEGTQPHPSAENWIKDLLSMPLPTRTRPSFPHNQSLPSGILHKPLIHFHQRADRMKPQSQKTNQTVNTWTTILPNSMKLWATACRATQDG